MAAIISLLRIPAARYNAWLERRPVLVKSLTSGLMYAAGDLTAQVIAHTRSAAKVDDTAASGDGGAGTSTGSGSVKGGKDAGGASGGAVVEEPRRGTLATFKVDWKRVGVFFVYGTVIAGPAYHVWFNKLDLLPGAMFQLRQARMRNEVLRAYALLRRHGVEVTLKMDQLPNAKPFPKWSEKAIKIAADQLVFSSLYTLVFFIR